MFDQGVQLRGQAQMWGLQQGDASSIMLRSVAAERAPYADLPAALAHGLIGAYCCASLLQVMPLCARGQLHNVIRALVVLVALSSWLVRWPVE